jgi:hypothetical protein
MEQQTRPQFEEFTEEQEQKDVVLNLTLTGARDCILNLLEQMDTVKGYSVLEGSFVVNSNEASVH